MKDLNENLKILNSKGVELETDRWIFKQFKASAERMVGAIIVAVVLILLISL